jgi:hypothetical protein
MAVEMMTVSIKKEKRIDSSENNQSWAIQISRDTDSSIRRFEDVMSFCAYNSRTGCAKERSFANPAIFLSRVNFTCNEKRKP